MLTAPLFACRSAAPTARVPRRASTTIASASQAASPTTKAPSMLRVTELASTPKPPSAAPASGPRPAPPPEPKKYRVVLSVGDSFNGAISLALAKSFEAEGARFVRDVWVGVAISTFDQRTRFDDLLRDSDPDLVLVSLGANDISSLDPDAATHVQSIVKKIGARDCYWIAPALWKKDTGIVDIIERNAAPCRFFASRGFKVERGRDGWHPSIQGGADWAAKFWEVFRVQRMSTAISPPHGTSML